MKVKKKCQDWFISVLEKRYPGIKDVVHLLDKIRDRVDKQYVGGLSELDAKKSLSNQTKSMFSQTESTEEDNDETRVSNIFKTDDGKWRPVVLTLGLLYKLQKVSDDHWYDDQSIFFQDPEKVSTVVELLAKYWWLSVKVAKNVRGSDKELYENIAKGLEISVEDVIYAHTKDAEKAVVEAHSPDIALVVHHETKEVVLTVCGTKMFPVPSVADILMDLYCDNVPFHQGRAHQGMAAACHNIVSMILDPLVTALNTWPEYKLVILGYSLGAGVAQLITIDLTQGPNAERIPHTTQVLCVTFGAPPVYTHNTPGFTLPNLISVYNHNDGLASLSLHTFTKLFLQIRAINRLGIGRRRIFRLLRKKIGQSSQAQTENSSVRVHVMNEDVKEREWGDILSAVKLVQKTGFHPLDHIAGLTYLVKRGENDKHVIRLLQGSKAEPLAAELRLRGGMFNDHMPWGYASLFKDCGGNSSGLSIDMITYL